MDTPRSGLYLVTLLNTDLISVKANDKRHADTAIRVNLQNCKFGKAKDLDKRFKDYLKTFGEENVVFKELALLSEIDIAEKAVLKRLDSFCILGATGHKNEWLRGIAPQEVVKIVSQTLAELGLAHKWIAE